ncbi:MAG: hypothetical protein K0Q59_1660 [Paenibacillus sp.]|nr:hypothetical protein [Paenibacillus sp.]
MAIKQADRFSGTHVAMPACCDAHGNIARRDRHGSCRRSRDRCGNPTIEPFIFGIYFEGEM